MFFLPIEHITYQTKLSEEEIMTRLAESVDLPLPPKWFQPYGYGYDKQYKGKIGEHNFNIERVIRYRNSFLPTIIGTITQGQIETTINVEMRLNFFAMLFLVCWCGSFVPMGFSVLSYAYEVGNIDIDALFPLGMVFGAYLITLLGFKIESIRSRREFKTIFDAEIIKG